MEIIFFIIIFIFGIYIGDDAGTSLERERWCKHKYEKVDDFEACKKTPDYEKSLSRENK